MKVPWLTVYLIRLMSKTTSLQLKSVHFGECTVTVVDANELSRTRIKNNTYLTILFNIAHFDKQ